MTGQATSVRVIAEAGVNHNGDLGRAEDMVHAAKEAGADLVKFQAFRTDGLVAGGAATAPYQKANTGADDQADLLRELEFTIDQFAALAELSASIGIEFLCTPFDVDMAKALVGLGMRSIKIASGELTNKPALERLGGLGLPVILSTGMATLDEVGQAIATLAGAGADDITLLHCTSLYPVAPEGVNLKAMVTMAERFSRPVGYSDHSLDDYVAVAAVALGASVIEKHFTLDRELPGPDHAASLEPNDLAKMIERLHATARALGDGEKRPAAGEADVARLVRRSWHAARDLAAGATIVATDIALKRPATGLSPYDAPIGRTLSADRKTDEPICERHLASSE